MDDAVFVTKLLIYTKLKISGSHPVILITVRLYQVVTWARFKPHNPKVREHLKHI